MSWSCMLIISWSCQVESWLSIYLFWWSVKMFRVWISYKLQTSSFKLRLAQKSSGSINQIRFILLGQFWLSICPEFLLLLVQFGLSIDNGFFCIKYGKIFFCLTLYLILFKIWYLILLLYCFCLVLGKGLFHFIICLCTGLF